MLDVFKLGFEKVLDLLRSSLFRCVLLAKDFRDVGRASSIPCKDLVKELAENQRNDTVLAPKTYVLSVTGNISETAHGSNRDQTLFELFGSDFGNSERRVLGRLKG